MTKEAKFYWYFLFLVPLLFSNTCNAQTDKDTELVGAIIGKTWMHSHEEDDGDDRIYRSGDYQFPPSRGREGFRMEQDSTFLFYGIAPTDGILVHIGYWSIDDSVIVVDFPHDRAPFRAMALLVEKLESEKITVTEMRIYDE
jgi:hypothetical protein